MFRIYPGCEFFSRVLSDSRSPTFCRYFKIGGNDMARKTNVPILSNRAHSTPLAEMRWSLPSKRAAISPFIDQLSAFIRTLHSGPQSCCRSRGRHRNGSAARRSRMRVSTAIWKIRASGFILRALAPWMEISPLPYVMKGKGSIPTTPVQVFWYSGVLCSGLWHR